MKPEQRCLFGAVAGAAIGAGSVAAILLAPQRNETGVFLIVAAAVLLLNVVLVGLRSQPLVRTIFSPRQSGYVAIAFGLFGASLLYGELLATSFVIGLGVAGVLIMAYAVVFARGRHAVPPDLSEAGPP